MTTKILSLPIAFAVAGLVSPATAQPAPPAEPPAVDEPTPPADDESPAPPAEPPPAEAEPAPVVADPAPAPVEPAAAPPPEPIASEPIAPGPPAALEPAPPETAPGPEFLPLRVRGSIWSRYELRSGYLDHGLTHPRLQREGDYVVSRARLGLATNPVDVGDGIEVSGTFVPQAAYTWGENVGTTPTISDHPAVVLYEGYASVGSESYRLDGGRFMMDYGDALIIGNLDWNESARAFNGVRLHLTPGEAPYFIDAFATIVNEGRTVTFEPVSGDTYFYGIYAGLGPLLAEGLDLDFYALGQTIAASDDVTVTDPMDPTITALGDQQGATEFTIGARVKGKASLVDYRAEAGIQLGARPVAPTIMALAPDARDKLAYQADAEVGVTPIKPLRIALEGLIASGDDLSTPDEDEGYNDLYPTGHKFLGLMDVTGARTNIVSAVLHLKYAIAPPLTLLVDAHYFARPEAGPDDRDGTVGEEVDVNLAYAIGKGFSVRGLYGIFLPDEDFWEPKATEAGAAGDPLHYVEVQFGYYFE